jgi:rhomboid protease GluP
MGKGLETWNNCPNGTTIGSNQTKGRINLFGHTHIPLRNFPIAFPVVTSILFVQTIVFLMLLFTGSSSDPEMWVRFGALEGWRVGEGDWWRLFISIFIHVGFLEFMITGFFLYIFGPQLEWLMGRIPFLILYLSAGAIFYASIYLLDIPGIYFGASGAIYGFMGVYLYLFLRKTLSFQLWMGFVALSVINLILNWSLAIPYLFAMITGLLLGAIILHFRSLQKR